MEMILLRERWSSEMKMVCRAGVFWYSTKERKKTNGMAGRSRDWTRMFLAIQPRLTQTENEKRRRRKNLFVLRLANPASQSLVSLVDFNCEIIVGPALSLCWAACFQNSVPIIRRGGLFVHEKCISLSLSLVVATQGIDHRCFAASRWRGRVVPRFLQSRPTYVFLFFPLKIKTKRKRKDR